MLCTVDSSRWVRSNTGMTTLAAGAVDVTAAPARRRTRAGRVEATRTSSPGLGAVWKAMSIPDHLAVVSASASQLIGIRRLAVTDVDDLRRHRFLHVQHESGEASRSLGRTWVVLHSTEPSMLNSQECDGDATATPARG
jgi:hypothetical protein